MPVIKTFIDVGATPEAVWRVLTNFPAYRNWHPSIRDAEGSAREKTVLRFRVEKNGKTRKLRVLVTRAMPAAELRWRERRMIEGILDSEQSFVIVPHGLKGVRLVHRERVSGLLARLVAPFSLRRRTASLEAVNAAVKKAAEARRS